MKNILFSFSLALISLASYSQSYTWGAAVGSTGFDTLTSAAVNQTTGEYVITGAISWNGPTNMNPLGSTVNVMGEDMHFITKYSPNGQLLWSMVPVYIEAGATGGNNTRNAFTLWNGFHDIEFDGNNNIWAIGSYANSQYNFNPLGVNAQYLSGPSWYKNVIITKYDENGILLNNLIIGNASTDQSGDKLAIDNANNVYTLGYFNGTDVYVDGVSNIPSGIDSIGSYLAKYDNNLNYLWAIQIGEGWISAKDVTTDNSGNSVVVGGLNSGNAAEINPLGVSTQLTAIGATDGFIGHYNASGVLNWGFNFGEAGTNTEVLTATTDNNDNVYVTGYFDGTNLNVNPLGVPTTISSSGMKDFFVAKYNASGILQWVNTYGSTFSDYAYGISYSNNELLVTGDYIGSVDFDPNGTGNVLTAYGSSDGFVLRLDNNGNHVSAFNVGGNSYDMTVAAYDNSVTNGVNVFGNFHGNAKLDPASTTSNAYSNGSTDMFMAFYCMPLTITHNPISDICEGSSPVALSGASIAGGDYYGSGVVNNSFYPLITGPGTYNLDYMYESPYGCTGSVSTSITVNQNPNVVLGSLPSFCDNEEVTSLYGGLPTGGTYGGNGVSSGLFDPQNAGIGQHMISYIYTDPSTGCTNTAYETVNVFETPALSLTTTDANCGEEDGSAVVSVTGGGLPYDYYWSNGVVTPANENISSGQYMITVTDGNGCSDFVIANVSDINGPSLSVDAVTNVTCYGDTTGAIDVSVSGGTGVLTFDWSNGDETEDIDGLAAGTYELIVSDENNCAAVVAVDILSPEMISLNETIVNPTCGATDGSVTLNTTGGNGNYAYNWSTGGTTNTISNIGLGIYSVDVTDQDGCSASFEIPVSELNAAAVSVVSVTPSPCNQSIGGATINTIGTAPFTYSWLNGGTVVSTSQNLSGVSYGTYTVEVTDDNGCAAVTEVEVEPEFPNDLAICMVTVDTATGVNLVVWEKSPVTYLDRYLIYRESANSGEYLVVGEVPYDSLSQFTDSVANPLVRSWRYKIAAVDLCGNESYLSAKHKTIHLTNAYGVGGQINLSWDNYEGFPYSTYDIWRWTDVDGYNLIQSLPSSLNSYTDFNIPADAFNVLYFIEVTPNDACVATRAINHNSTRSNRTNQLAGPANSIVETSILNKLTVYPQPNQGVFNVNVSVATATDATFKLVSMDGRLIDFQELDLVSGENVLSFNTSAEKGMYQLIIQLGDEFFVEQVMIIE